MISGDETAPQSPGAITETEMVAAVGGAAGRSELGLLFLGAT